MPTIPCRRFSQAGCALIGGETLEGEHGKKPKEAIITPGMAVTSFVAADTPLTGILDTAQAVPLVINVISPTLQPKLLPSIVATAPVIILILVGMPPKAESP